VRLSDDGEGTLMKYEARADAGGKLAQLGGGLIDSAAKKLTTSSSRNSPPSLTHAQGGGHRSAYRHPARLSTNFDQQGGWWAAASNIEQNSAIRVETAIRSNIIIVAGEWRRVDQSVAHLH
jgi:hypothetical protein